MHFWGLEKSPFWLQLIWVFCCCIFYFCNLAMLFFLFFSMQILYTSFFYPILQWRCRWRLHWWAALLSCVLVLDGWCDFMHGWLGGELVSSWFISDFWWTTHLFGSEWTFQDGWYWVRILKYCVKILQLEMLMSGELLVVLTLTSKTDAVLIGERLQWTPCGNIWHKLLFLTGAKLLSPS